MAKKPGTDPFLQFFQAIKGLIEPTPHSGDDAVAASEAPSGSGAVKPLYFSAKSRAALSLLVLRDQVNALAPSRSRASDGIIGDDNHKNTKSDHNPWVMDGDVGVVTAIDITHDPERGCDAQALADSLVASRDERIKYLIHNRRIVTSYTVGNRPAWVWGPYAKGHPHTGHVHLSVLPKKALFDSVKGWDLSGMPGGSKKKPSAKTLAEGIAKPATSKPAFDPAGQLAWGKRVSKDFRARVIEMADRLLVDPNTLMAVMAFETDRSFSPSKKSYAGNGATGLIQFTSSTAKDLGTTTAELAKMDAVEQLDWVEKYFRRYAGKMSDLPSVYMAVLYPKAIAQPLSYVLFASPGKAYKLNIGLDTNDDGKVTKAEAAAKVQAALIEGMRPENIG